jgi:glycerol-3-phosphate dehydrogenase (NAD(P)+)
VTLIARTDAVADEINGVHRNSAYLGGQDLSSSLVATTDWSPLKDAGLVLSAVPAQATRQVLASVPEPLRVPVPVIATAKGFEAGSLALQSSIIAAVWPAAKAMVLSGPSFAVDVVRGRPTAVTLAGDEEERVREMAERMASASFRPYVSTDRTGVELAGGLKNVYALAAGAVEGAGLGLSARSALMARAHAEMSRLVVKMGGQAPTLVGLAGLGDLALSCTSTQSRNYAFGIELGKGRTVEAILADRPGLCEGVTTAPVARGLAAQAGVEVPLIEAVNLLLEDRMEIADLVRMLMSRPLKKEDE